MVLKAIFDFIVFVFKTLFKLIKIVFDNIVSIVYLGFAVYGFYCIYIDKPLGEKFLFGFVVIAVAMLREELGKKKNETQ